ncbi:hypothetical protein [Oryzomonas rubra]|uniref:hypothetical protein n=1 Tax=Oryzomonas rubra TaxID=2509454 RepID=UPI00165D5F84|nr:hypothetical protein [Oryzomonas rubra]
MKKLIWKIRYMRDMARRTGKSRRFCWWAAGREVKYNPDWRDDSPHDAVTNEMSFWN